jgi:hypothetical protein
MVLYFTAHTFVMSNNMNKTSIAVLSLLVAMTLALTSHSTYGQSVGNATQSAGGNASQDIGTAQQLSESLGNNTELLANKTPIGNPNASMAEKAAMESTTTGNESMQTGNETANQSGNQSGNQSNPISGLLEGIGKLLGNATGN